MKFLNRNPLRTFYRVSGLLAACLLTFFIPVLNAQQESIAVWSEIEESAISTQATRYIIPDHYRTLELDVEDMAAVMKLVPEGKVYEVRNSNHIFAIPMPDGSFQNFRILETSIMEEPLKSDYASIKTFTGEGIDDPYAYLKMDLTEQGFHAMILTNSGSVFVDPYAHLDNRYYISYYKKDLRKTAMDAFECLVDNTDNPLLEERTDNFINVNRVPDCDMRTYRLAVGATGEYTQFHGGTVSLGLAAINTTVNRVNGVYERDLALTMTLVGSNNLIVYTNGNTDPYSNTNSFSMLGENQTTCNTVIGSGNYDIGHVFSTGGGGVASLNSPCTSSKARGVSGQFAPIGDPFDIDYVAHEMGHQYGGNHTQNNNCNRSYASYEPGSASTIMGYAGICSPNVQSNSDALFHAINLQEMSNNIVSGNSSTCPVTVNTSNSAPTANAGPNYTIPRSTPYELVGIGTDPNPGDALSYSWEQWDPEIATMPPSPSSTLGPNTRTYLPASSNKRMVPPINNVVNNTNNTWDVLPSVARQMEFRLTVRDNFPGAGCTDEDNMIVTVAGNSGPFLVTSPNTSGVTWSANTTQTVTWDVANTTSSPVSAANVDIFLSVDGGFNYPYTLATNVPNTGSANIIVPVVTSSLARVRVQGSNNIFFDISNANFTIDNNNPGVCNPTPNLFANNITSGTVRLNWDAVPGADHYEIRGFVTGSPGEVYLSVPSGAPTFKDIIGLSASTEYWWQVITYCNADETDASVWSAIDTFTTDSCPTPSLAFTTNFTSTSVRLAWSAVAGATGYTIRGRQVGGPFITLPVSGPFTTFFDVTGLTPNTWYEWQIAANCGFVTSNYTMLMTFVTNPSNTSKGGFGRSGSPADNMTIYPNPTSGLITIKIDNFELSDRAIFSIYDLKGQQIEQMEIGPQGGEEISLDLSHLPQGVYNAMMQNSQMQEIRKLVIVK